MSTTQANVYACLQISILIWNDCLDFREFKTRLNMPMDALFPLSLSETVIETFNEESGWLRSTVSKACLKNKIK